jgi:hypothetical protein
MFKAIKIFLLFFLLTGCSYDPILINKSFNFQFSEINTTGNKEINKIIKKNLKEKNNKGKKYSINLKTKKEKEVISSNAKGDPEVFKLKIILEYQVTYEGRNILVNNILEEFTYNNMGDKFELLKIEENIIKTIAKKIANEISITVLSNNQ